ncbi:MAG TPA: Asp-tRNA(Asn)/Glu-tRNA(Gln) amidotransferase subunit GatB, partial [Microthrixaceae bacterium]|nr:Asp-tRNA(Asn)/Glu-tRNA(Gln) amidotransferase subunit GatB [Microthrixaceae bacterium]
HRLAESTGSGLEQAALIVERGLDDLCLSTIELGADPARVLTHAEHNMSDERSLDVAPARFAELVSMEVDGKLTATQTKAVLAEMIDTGDAPADIAARNGFEAMDSGALESVVDGLIAEHPDEWQRFCDGDGKVTGFFVGKVMKATQGKADGKAVTALLNARKA